MEGGIHQMAAYCSTHALYATFLFDKTYDKLIIRIFRAFNLVMQRKLISTFELCDLTVYIDVIECSLNATSKIR